ncbi:MAG TPA: hypothetical protein VN923_14860, partial [Thermoanaerobaculia bacterium]|nr:hypothetical protein [Thermoanaerobaculia bacterium]
NPPYLDPVGPVMPEVAAWEPPGALWAGPRGLVAYEALLAGLATLRPGTALLLELGFGQASAVGALAERHGFRVQAVAADLAGIERVLSLQRR